MKNRPTVKIKIILSNGKVREEQINLGLQFDSNKYVDLKVIANSVFIIESKIKEGQVIKEVQIPLYDEYSDKVRIAIMKLIESLFSKSVSIKFIKNKQERFIDTDLEIKNDYTCLFSGGMDSFVGILNLKEKFPNVTGAFTQHDDQRVMGALIRKLQKKVLNKYDIKVTEIKADKNENYTRTTRGIVYIFNAVSLGNRNIVVSEIGPTMYQPKFTLLDTVSHTTHPTVLEFCKTVANEVVNTDVKIYIPDENLTKAELAASCIEKNYLKLTCSCRTVRFCLSKTPNCGSCYGCIIRKLGLSLADINDSRYRNDVLALDSIKTNKQHDNVLHLLSFSKDFLDHPEGLPHYATETIKKYRKEDLFRRFSLDTFSGLLILKKQHKLHDKLLLNFLDAGLKICSKEKLEDRIEAVRMQKFKPDFTKRV